MNEIQTNRVIIRQLKDVRSIVEEHERPKIQAMIERRQFRQAFLLYEKRLESSLNGPFDHIASRKLDAIRVLIDD